MRSAKNKAFLAAAVLFAAMANAQPTGTQRAPANVPAPSAPAHAEARPVSMSNSVVTVEDLLALEDTLARKHIQKVRVEAGLATPEAAANSVQPPKGPASQQAVVESIVGVGEQLRASITVDGRTHENLRPGQRVGDCEIEWIANRCVSFRPRAAAGKGAPRVCPAACWTGDRPLTAAQFAPGAPSHPLPPGIPTPGYQAGSMPYPALPAQGQQAVTQPAPARP